MLVCLVFGCDDDNSIEKPLAESRYVAVDSSHAVSFRDEVSPVLNNRCVVCHGCYDAPCQLKLSSAAGINRGANKDKVYDGTRLTADPLMRLFVDAQSIEGWRSKNFFPVLNEQKNANPQDSVMYQLLDLKQRQALPAKHNQRLADDAFDLSLSRADVCPTQNEIADYVKAHPLNGMPYALPALNEAESKTLLDWIESGAPLANQPKLDEPFLESIELWETFLNEDSLKAQLVSRYIYEHLFLANIYFEDLPLTDYFKLVRSSIGPGEPISIIATRRPFDDPTSDASITAPLDRVYYRLQRVENSIVAKNHLPYALNPARLERFRALFFEPEYSVEKLPGYDPQQAANPFETFHALPANSRYRFMLEQSKFTIRGFMKGAVCRGQVALNVIDDHFWVFFANPEHDIFARWSDSLPRQLDRLDLPAERSSTAGVLSYWTEYSDSQAAYLKAKSKLFSTAPQSSQPDLDWVWQGDGHNENASLTVFRHFDSASVVKGLVGTPPKTAWLIDYPILERIHYLLVAGFDVYGNGGHQLATRLYMDFLRMESEFNFLALLPEQTRLQLRDHWYRDADEAIKNYVYGNYAYLRVEPKIEYPQSQSAKISLYEKLQRHLRDVLPIQHLISRAEIPVSHRSLGDLHQVESRSATLMPEMSLLLVNHSNKPGRLYTILRNSGHSNITSLFLEDANRLPDEDYLTIMPTVVGSYPDALWQVDEEQLDDFISGVKSLDSEQDFSTLMQTFGIRRSHRDFWQHSDVLHQLYQQTTAVEYGILDYNRLENR